MDAILRRGTLSARKLASLLSSASDGSVAVSSGATSPITLSSRSGGKQNPIVALIGHSYVVRHTQKKRIASIQRSAGTVTMTTYGSLNGSATGYVYKIDGCGAPYDNNYARLTSVDNTNFIYTWTISDVTTGAPLVPTTGYAFDLGSGGGSSGGWGSSAWLCYANAVLGNVFDMPRGYMFGHDGGGFVSLPGAPGDPGFLLECQRLAAKSPTPDVVVVDLGINDFSQGQTLTAVMTAITAGMAVLNTFTRNVIFTMPRGFNGTAAVGQQVAKFVQEMERGAAAGLWYTFNSRRRTMNQASASGAMIAGMTDDGIHLNPNGSIQDGYQFAQDFAFIFPAYAEAIIGQTDLYNSTNNTEGDLTGAGMFTAVAGPITLNSTPAAIGGVYASVTGAGTSIVTAEIKARVDTYPDNSVVPGFELVITFAAGAGARNVLLTFGPNGASGYSQLGPGGGSSTYYAAGDEIYAQMEAYVDPASIGTATDVFPTLTFFEASTFSQFSRAFNDGLFAVTKPVGGRTVIAAPMIKTAAISLGAPSDSAYFGLQANLFVNGTVNLSTIYRIRSAFVRKNISTHAKYF